MKTQNILLSNKQKLFCHEYVKDFNGHQAAIRAGYSRKTARIQASQHLTKLNIQKYLGELSGNLLEKVEVNAEMVVAEIKKIGFSKITDFLNWDATGKMTFKSSDEIDSSPIAKIQSSDTKEGKKSLEFRLHDKLKALEMLCKYLKMFSNTQINQTNNMEKVIIAPYLGRNYYDNMSIEEIKQKQLPFKTFEGLVQKS